MTETPNGATPDHDTPLTGSSANRPSADPYAPPADPYAPPEYPTQVLPPTPDGPAPYPDSYGAGPGVTAPAASPPVAPPAWSAYQPGWQPPAPPGGGPGGSGGDRHGGRRPGRAVGLVVAVALAAGLVGGGIGAVTTHYLDGSSGNAVVTSLSTVTPGTPTSANVANAGAVAQVAAEVLPSVVSITVTTSNGGDEGSGVVLSSSGYILTNNHVIAAAAGGGGQIAVTFNTGKTVSATIVGRDTVSDLAVIKVSGVSGLTPASLGSSASLVVGQPVVAVGSPLGLSGTVTSGIVSALHRPVSTAGAGAAQGTVFDAIQTDAPINPGNSGGPLVNLSGQVVGINSAIATLGTSNPFGSSGQSGSIGLGFSIPIDTARPIAAQLIKTGTASYALLGVEISNATSSQGVPDGAQVRVVQSGSPAAKAGLKVGDVITGLGSLRIDSADALIAAVHAQQPGSTVTITYRRAGTSHTVTVNLAAVQS